jgi:ABC-type transport system involved in multi-copper enzyme maturation permease subunit
MQTAWLSLLWKEWHETKWKLAALMAILVGALLFVALLKGLSDAVMALPHLIIAYGVLLSFIIGMGTAASENAKRTMPFLQALPVPMWKAAAAKLLWASVAILAPIVVAVGLVCVWLFVGGYFDPASADFSWLQYGIVTTLGPDAWGLFGIACLLSFTLSPFVWVAATGVNRSDEIRAVGMALLVILGFCFFVGVLANWFDWSLRRSPWLQAASAMLPAGFFQLGNREGAHSTISHGFPLLAALASHTVLVLWFLGRFGRVAPTARESRKPASRTGETTTELAPPRRTRLTAILWQQSSETGPLLLFSAAAIIGLAAFLTIEHSAGPMRSDEFGFLLQSTTFLFGFFVAIVAGISVLMDDLKPGLHDFWRSRPINTDLWFWAKFLTGLVLTLIAFGIPYLLARWLGEGERGPWDETSPMLPLALLLSIYSFAVVAMALVRRPLYAAIFAVGMFAFGMVGIEYVLPKSFEFEWAAVSILAIILSVIVTLVAWLAVRYDIGYKGW